VTLHEKVKLLYDIYELYVVCAQFGHVKVLSS
jgi:hypothetical protein